MVDLFSGIGGFSLAASWVWPDIEIACFVEIDSFCQKVLAKNFPGVPIYGDITKIQWVAADADGLNGNDGGFNASEISFQQKAKIQRIPIRKIDLLTGGFPCQPFSCAGKRAGAEDDRFLWPEMLRAIREIKPRWVIAENVPGLLTIERGMVFERVCVDLENEGYTVFPPLFIGAVSKGAPHRRTRVWIVAHGAGSGWREGNKNPCRPCQGTGKKGKWGGPSNKDRHAADSELWGCKQKQRRTGISPTAGGQEANQTGCNGNWQEHWYEVATRLCRVDARVPNRVDRLKSLGNAIVPQVAAEIMRAIKEVDG